MVVVPAVAVQVPVYVCRSYGEGSGNMSNSFGIVGEDKSDRRRFDLFCSMSLVLNGGHVFVEAQNGGP